MNPLGIVSESTTRASARKPPFIPSFGFHEVHESQPIDAPPASIIDVVASLDMRADPVIDTLLTMREFPAAVAGALRHAPARPERARFGFDTFTPLHRDDTSLSLGLVGRFWRPTPDVRAVADADAFVRHDDPRDAKLVLRFEVVGLASGAHILRTETFVHCPSARTRWLFTPYWLAIRVGSGWIRRRTLAAVEMALA
ncbi:MULTISPECIES: hypothetical protein [Burkholderia]|uniref:hypothetical protein n=1 Tax=Burkholderia TaxID=32008 RepID=UPI0006791AE9|nr:MULTISPECIES: hypothetical protein [Burkholderia]KWU27329.1 hypothetical protein AS149_22945 [Burkholderia cenocepacia]OXI68795.1 hypothetical protein CFB44_28165 [Burkholderia sp. AU31280]QRR16461.1 hypothetical protein GJG85_24225 [Burkholderia sp. MS389]QVN13974.1 hypothetical protein JYG37_26290 [Burkholderia sp. LAS2]RQU39061.1 hypothetical protein DF147_22910 [Burkholderia cenocepacia]